MNVSEADEPLWQAARAIAEADALLIGAGAGMGVDSGLPDFRGQEGFWKAYPPFRKLGLSFAQLANPQWFDNDPHLAWGFYGHRLQLYRETAPHAGFQILLQWGRRAPGGYFVFTSNIDGHFQKAGFDEDRVVECHGSIHHLQCTNALNARLRDCREQIWPADCDVSIDPIHFVAEEPLPVCPACDSIARPNVLMFGDWSFISDRTDEQHNRYRQWVQANRTARLVVVELGAGSAVPTVRHECERRHGHLIRINPREPNVPPKAISIAAGALETLTRIDRFLAEEFAD